MSHNKLKIGVHFLQAKMTFKFSMQTLSDKKKNDTQVTLEERLRKWSSNLLLVDLFIYFRNLQNSSDNLKISNITKYT